jgi:WD repeat-containing protein 21A
LFVAELPGFYYDQQKKRYFQILPGHNVNSGVITKEALKMQEQEHKRVCDLEKPSRLPQSVGLLDVLHCVSCGSLPSLQYARQVRNCTFSCLKPRGYGKIPIVPGIPFQEVEHFQKLLLSPGKDSLLSLWSLKGTLAKHMQIVKIGSVNFGQKDRLADVPLEPIGNSVRHTCYRITNMEWAPLSDNVDEKNVLYTSVYSRCMSNTSSCAIIRNLSPDPAPADTLPPADFNLGKVVPWTCAWNRLLHRFSVGSEKCGLLVDVQTRRMWEFFTERSDVLAQCFSQDTGQALYSGTRAGRIFCHDLRSASTHSVFALKNQISVNHVKLRLDENYLIASEVSGEVRICHRLGTILLVVFHR